MGRLERLTMKQWLGRIAVPPMASQAEVIAGMSPETMAHLGLLHSIENYTLRVAYLEREAVQERRNAYRGLLKYQRKL